MAQLFPIYFSMQVALPAVLALTYTSPLNNTSGIGGIGGIGGTSGLAGVLEVSNRWTVLAPLAGAFVCAAGNLAVVGPRTTRVMELRRGQGAYSFLVAVYLFSCVWLYVEVGCLRGGEEEGVAMSCVRCAVLMT